MKNSVSKDFDCAELQDREALRVHEETKDMTREEELAYWRRISDEARKMYPLMREAPPANSSRK